MAYIVMHAPVWKNPIIINSLVDGQSLGQSSRRERKQRVYVQGKSHVNSIGLIHAMHCVLAVETNYCAIEHSRRAETLYKAVHSGPMSLLTIFCRSDDTLS